MFMQVLEMLYDEVFFLVNHMGMAPNDVWQMYPYERKWYITKFIQHKEKENEIINKSMRK